MDQAKSLQQAYRGPSPELSLDIIWSHGEPRGESWGESRGELVSVLNWASHR